MTNQGLIRLCDWGWSKFIYGQMHDAILLTVPESRLQMAAKTLQKAMTHEFIVKGRKLIIPIELKYGKKWGEMHEVKTNA